jgi:ankyrin repeat protein
MGNQAIVELLLEHKADVNAQGGQYGNALQAAISMHNNGIVQLLQKHNANVNAQYRGYEYVNAQHRGYENVNVQHRGYENVFWAAASETKVSKDDFVMPQHLLQRGAHIQLWNDVYAAAAHYDQEHPSSFSYII